MIEHTPGPWRKTSRAFKRDDIWFCPVWSIEGSPANAYGSTKEEAEANATLIAGAVRMLITLQNVVHLLDRKPIAEHPDFLAARNKAIEMIYEVTGEPVGVMVGNYKGQVA